MFEYKKQSIHLDRLLLLYWMLSMCYTVLGCVCFSSFRITLIRNRIAHIHSELSMASMSMYISSEVFMFVCSLFMMSRTLRYPLGRSHYIHYARWCRVTAVAGFLLLLYLARCIQNTHLHSKKYIISIKTNTARFTNARRRNQAKRMHN